MRDDPAWMAAESRRLERMAPHQEELVISSFFHVAEEVVPPAARSSRGDAVTGRGSRVATSRLTTFSDGVRGKSSKTSTDSGHVYFATPSASRNSCSSVERRGGVAGLER